MKKQIYLISIVVILIFGFSFFWFLWRPSQIKKNCLNLVNNQSVFNPQKFANQINGKTYFDITAYNKCLIDKGL